MSTKKEYKLLIGSREQVMKGIAKKTGGGLMKKDLKYNKYGKIISKKASKTAKKSNNLVNKKSIPQKGGNVFNDFVYNFFEKVFIKIVWVPYSEDNYKNKKEIELGKLELKPESTKKNLLCFESVEPEGNSPTNILIPTSSFKIGTLHFYAMNRENKDSNEYKEFKKHELCKLIKEKSFGKGTHNCNKGTSVNFNKKNPKKNQEKEISFKIEDAIITSNRGTDTVHTEGIGPYFELKLNITFSDTRSFTSRMIEKLEIKNLTIKNYKLHTNKQGEHMLGLIESLDDTIKVLEDNEKENIKNFILLKNIVIADNIKVLHFLKYLKENVTKFIEDGEAFHKFFLDKENIEGINKYIEILNINQENFKNFLILLGGFKRKIEDYIKYESNLKKIK